VIRIFALTVFALFAIGAAPPAQETLPGGARLAWWKDDTFPLVDLAIVFPVGHRNDPAGKSGIGELLAAVLERQLGERIRPMGASRAVQADEESLSVGVHGLSSDAQELWLALWSVVSRPSWEPGTVERERDRVLDRWRHLRDSRELLAGLAFHRAAFLGTPYSRGAVAGADELRKIGSADVIAHARSLMGAPLSGAKIVVAGQVKDAMILRQTVLESISKNAASEPNVLTPPSRAARSGGAKPTHVRVVDDGPGELVSLVVGVDPAALPPIEGDRVRVAVCDARMRTKLHELLKIADGTRCHLEVHKEASRIAVSVATRTDLAVQAVTEIMALLASPPTEEELDRAKRKVDGAEQIARTTLPGRVSEWLASQMPVAPAVATKPAWSISAAGDGSVLQRVFKKGGYREILVLQPDVLIRTGR